MGLNSCIVVYSRITSQRPTFCHLILHKRLAIFTNMQSIPTVHSSPSCPQQNQMNQISAMQEQDRPNGQQDDDFIIDSQNCCTPLIRKTNSSQSIQHTANSQKSISLNKEKGIQLTSKAKSFTRLTTQIKLNVKRTDSLKLEENPHKKISENSPMINAESTLNISQRKMMPSQRCINYKNKKVQEHRHDEVERSSNYMKQQELYSTRKETARTLKNSEDLCFQKSHSFFRNLAVQHSTLRGFHQQKNHNFCEARQANGCQLTQKKTLQRVFEETQGRRIVTLESQISNNEDEQSIAQSFVLRQDN